MLKKLFRKSTYRTIRTKLFPYKILADEYYDTLYLACSGSTLFAPENLYCIDHAVRNLPTNDPVIEIGSFTGMSTNMTAYYLRKHQRENLFFNTDKWEFEEKEKEYYVRVLNCAPDDMRRFVKESYIRNLQFFNRNRLPLTLEMFSDEFFQKWKAGTQVTDLFGRTVRMGGAISFAYVDGNHQYEYVKRDFENIHPLLVKGGFIFFDDSAAHIKCGISELVKNEIRRRTDYEVVLKNPNYLFRKIE